MKVTATAPTRVDLAGGTLDLWPIHNLLPKRATVNVAVSLNATATVELTGTKRFHFKSIDQNMEDFGTFEEILCSSKSRLMALLLQSVWNKDLPAVSITTAATSPAGAGLGGSSCLAVTILKALWGAKAEIQKTSHEPNEEGLVRCAQDVESVVIHAPTGVQDYWGAVRGGLNILNYKFGETLVETMPATHWETAGFKILCCYSGKSRASAINNWEIFKRIFDGDTALLKNMMEIGEVSLQCADALRSKNWEGVLSASGVEWSLRKKLWPAVETSETKKIDIATKNAGAHFSRVCGAGGGGVMAVFAPKERVANVISAMADAGGTYLDVTVGAPGLRVIA
jgi:D-glycero-alpha-D-manno-heptose-7-phosphate kinase